MKDQERPENCEGQEEPKEEWQLSAIWDPGQGPGAEKTLMGKLEL